MDSVQKNITGRISVLLTTCICFTIFSIHIWASFLYEPYGLKVAKWFGMSHNDYMEFFTLATLCAPVTIPLCAIAMWYIFYLNV
jgi:hypothetical protein